MNAKLQNKAQKILLALKAAVTNTRLGSTNNS